MKQFQHDRFQFGAVLKLDGGYRENANQTVCVAKGPKATRVRQLNEVHTHHGGLGSREEVRKVV